MAGLACTTGCLAASSRARPANTVGNAERIVNLGDSITDGQTYAVLVAQALEEAGKPAPHFIGAGIGGDTSAGMLARLERDVFVRHPAMVMLNCGINDLGKGVALTNYEANVTAIAQRMKAEKVTLMLLTTTDIRGGADGQQLEAIRAILHRVAARYNLPIADVYDRMEEARKSGQDLWVADGCHLNFAGYRALSRAVLDALGYPDVAVPTAMHCQPLPGLIARWKTLTVDAKTPPLDTARVAALKVDDTWKDYTLPEKDPHPDWWADQQRLCGYSVSLNRLFGTGRHYAVAEVPSKARKVFLNTGGELGAVWLNGKKVPLQDRGWHAGGNRIPVDLIDGTNTIVVETGNCFFVSITDDDTW